LNLFSQFQIPVSDIFVSSEFLGQPLEEYFISPTNSFGIDLIDWYLFD